MSVDDEHARYDYGTDPGDPRRGVLVIPVRDPEAWFIEGRDDRSRMAGIVMARTVRGFESTGTWPEWASSFTR